ncbi:glycosyltransferase family 4 protein [Agrobacterium tumefaciens]|uniref:glycosyltransferase family 4 protein n=1 Tax=Agrobacterium tumefaciens TaxID=358 RepID=UPI0021CE624E|nr:glycosyltransferase family 1 protein [Agrobacterium tumefaciens]UXS05110.1 glycosyltransferase family 4 protein [Agrobacterium tumefaciens]
MVSAKKTKVVINGKFLSAGQTAVHRVAEEYTLAFDRLLARDPEFTRNFDFILAVPPDAIRNLDLSRIEIVTCGLSGGVLWEQVFLPLYSRSALLLNFCNLGPAFKRRAATLIHDVQAYSTPESNSRKFRLLYKSLTPLLCRFSKKIFAVSDYSAGELRSVVPQVKEIVTVHNGCDHVLRAAPSEKLIYDRRLPIGKYCVALANPKPHKNIKVLLSAFSDPRLASVPLVLFGPGSKADFEKAGINVPNNIVFVGRVDDGELAGLISNAGLLAFPSLTEGFGLPPLEAMALGCPVVIAPKGSLPEICGDSALRADPFVAEEWIQAIRRVLDTEIVSSQLRESGLARSSRFNWENAARKIMTDSRELWA